MRAVIQRVKRAHVTVDQKVTGTIGPGIVLLIGIEEADESADIDWILRKVSQLKIFQGDDGRLSENLLTTNGELLIISQFTLHASTKKGTRPSFHRAAHPSIAQETYNAFLSAAEALLPRKVQCGTFGAHMDIDLVNDGPITLNLDSKNPE